MSRPWLKTPECRKCRAAYGPEWKGSMCKRCPGKPQAASSMPAVQSQIANPQSQIATPEGTS